MLCINKIQERNIQKAATSTSPGKLTPELQRITEASVKAATVYNTMLLNCIRVEIAKLLQKKS